MVRKPLPADHINITYYSQGSKLLSISTKPIRNTPPRCGSLEVGAAVVAAGGVEAQLFKAKAAKMNTSPDKTINCRRVNFCDILCFLMLRIKLNR